ncbi:MAG: ribosomal protein [Candidatus Saccharibacteria bacterium]|nr:ribosomal protein [Candidatus Saccharibacteria bacterium]
MPNTTKNQVAAADKVRAYAKGVDQAPRKVSLVASLVRNRTVADAIVILNHTPKRAARPLIKVIESARANAINNHGFDGKTLTISTLSVTTGTRLKRFVPASRGRALPFQKKSSNILIEVTGAIKVKKAPAKAAAVEAEATPVKKTTKVEEKK